MLFLRLLAVALAFAGIRGVGIILVDERGRFLVNLRASRPAEPKDNAQWPARTFLAGRWALPAGPSCGPSFAPSPARPRMRPACGTPAKGDSGAIANPPPCGYNVPLRRQ